MKTVRKPIPIKVILFAVLLGLACRELQAQIPVQTMLELPEPDKSVPFYKNFRGGMYAVAIKSLVEIPKAGLRISPSIEILDLEKPLEGRICFFSNVADVSKNPPPLYNTLTFASLPKSNQEAGDQPGIKNTAVTYQVFATNLPFEPMFSPDGRTLLFKIGAYPRERFDGYGAYYWNFEKKSLSLIVGSNSDASPLFYPTILWSHGSRYLSYLREGNALGDYDPWTKSYKLFVFDRKNGKDRELAANVGLYWSWTYHGQLLFGRVPPEQFEALSQRQVRPSVYVADAASGEPKKLFDGGYFANESPDGQWIAFCDWPGKLIDAVANTSKELQDSGQRGLFLFHKPTGKRVFVGDLKLPATGGVWMQWSPDGSSLYLLEHTVEAAGVTGTIYKINVGRMPNDKPAMSQLTQIVLKSDTPSQGGFAPRGTSPDGRTFYLNAIGWRNEPKNSVVSTLTAIDTQSGKQTPIARMTNVNNENPDWDWHDDSGVNPAFAAAAKFENSLPVVREGNKDADPKMALPANPAAR